jgi:[ribosomal protein S18]-alanine N-acetyltransferase
MIFARRRPTPSVLRPLRATQAADCARIHADGFAFPWAQSELESLISSPNALGMAALDPVSAQLRGFALSRLAADEAEILTIAVEAVSRKGGVGRDLLHAHLSQVGAAGAKNIFLEVDANNAAALALYRRFQFVQVGERKAYYARPDGQSATALIMRRDLT